MRLKPSNIIQGVRKGTIIREICVFTDFSSLFYLSGPKLRTPEMVLLFTFCSHILFRLLDLVA